MKRNSLFQLIISFYQLVISPFLGSNCRFHPSCSAYSKECFQLFPFYKAMWYSSLRILRCHPFHKGGFDPVKKPLT